MNHPLIQEGQRERYWREVDLWDMPSFQNHHVHDTPSPKVFIAHLLCLAQMLDDAGLFVLFFYVKGIFHHPVQTPLITSVVPK